MRHVSVHPLHCVVDPLWRIAIVHSSYYKEEVHGLIEGAKDVLLQAGIKASNITTHEAAGSFEIR